MHPLPFDQIRRVSRFMSLTWEATLESGAHSLPSALDGERTNRGQGNRACFAGPSRAARPNPKSWSALGAPGTAARRGSGFHNFFAKSRVKHCEVQGGPRVSHSVVTGNRNRENQEGDRDWKTLPRENHGPKDGPTTKQTELRFRGGDALDLYAKRVCMMENPTHVSER
jgi:hypothetical protein